MQAEFFTNNTLDPIPLNRGSGGFARNGQSQPWETQLILSDQDGKIITGKSTRASKDTLVVLRPDEAAASAERLTGGDGQALSRALPFARRRLITIRPDAVRIRALKPWVRLRLRLLG